MSLVAKGVFLEISRRKDAYVLFILMSFFLLGVIIVNIVGISEGSTATFLLNMGMSLAFYAAHILTLIQSARQLPDEIENRTLYPLLAKPLARSTVYMGKWAACTIGGTVVLICLTFMGWFPVPKMEEYSLAMLLQVIVLGIVSLGLISSMGLFCSLIFPRAVTIVILGLVAAFGQKAMGAINTKFFETPLYNPVRWLTAYLPDFTKLNTITRYTDGITALSFGEFFGLVLYGVILITFFLTAGMIIFRRRPL